jgi:hypothetical protein
MREPPTAKEIPAGSTISDVHQVGDNDLEKFREIHCSATISVALPEESSQIPLRQGGETNQVAYLENLPVSNKQTRGPKAYEQTQGQRWARLNQSLSSETVRFVDIDTTVE